MTRVPLPNAHFAAPTRPPRLSVAADRTASKTQFTPSARHDADWTVLSCLSWRCELALRPNSQRPARRDETIASRRVWRCELSRRRQSCESLTVLAICHLSNYRPTLLDALLAYRSACGRLRTRRGGPRVFKYSALRRRLFFYLFRANDELRPSPPLPFLSSLLFFPLLSP